MKEKRKKERKLNQYDERGFKYWYCSFKCKQVLTYLQSYNDVFHNASYSRGEGNIVQL